MPRRSRKTSFWLACLLLVLAIGCAKDVTDYPSLRLIISSEPPLQPGATIASLQLSLRSPDGQLKLPAPGKEADLTFALPAGRNIVTTPYSIDLAQPPGSAGIVQLRVLGVEKKQVLTAWSGVVDTRTTGTLELTLRAPQANCDADADGVADCQKIGCCSDPGAPSDCNDDGATDKDGVPVGYSSNPFNTENACTQCGNGLDEDCDGTDLACVDTDKDGVPDCQEAGCLAGASDDPAIFPGALEVCDGKDNDCDLLVDEGLATAEDPSPTHQVGGTCGFGVCAGGHWQCDPTGAKKPMVCSTADKKAAKEDCTNDADDDCDGQINQGCDELLDIDGDGVNNDVEKAKCDYKFAQYHAEFFPGAAEKCCPVGVVDTTICDTNCDGHPTPCDPTDKDGDGYPAKKDCDDTDPLTYLGAPEKCGDGKSQSCQVDPPCDARDKDGDGWLEPADCDDTDKAVNPEAKELCNGRDDNCNGITDDGNPEGLDAACGNLNGECGHVGDKFGQTTGFSVCKHYKFGQQPTSSVECATPSDAKTGTCVGCDGDQRPQAEQCNGKDDNCDAKTDEPFTYWQEDNTLVALGGACDGVGACGMGVVECKNAGSAACSSDADGSKPQSTVETCNNVDDNCNGKVDENLTSLADSTCQKVGVCAAGLSAIKTICFQGAWTCNYSQVPGIEISSDPKDECGIIEDPLCNCGGSTPICHNMVEVSCDGLDNDCDGKTDDDFDYVDFDGIALRKIGETCLTGACGGGTVVCGADKSTVTCSSLDQIKTEQCNLLDDNCNGVTDESSDLPVEKSTCKQTGVCAVTKPKATCSEGGWLCDYSAVPDWQTPIEATCDGLDNDCNGTTDDGCDDDGDGFCDGTMGWTAGATVTCKKSVTVNLLDCNDTTKGVSPSALEVCNNVDDNCNGETDEGCDNDKDGYCDANMLWFDAPTVCPLSTSVTVLDCNDENDAVHPAAVEACNDVDDDCANGPDEGCDDDGDGFCDGAIPLVGASKACKSGGGDCNDGDSAIHPGAIDVCDDVDNDCNATVDDSCDGDSDGFCDAKKATLGKPATCPQGGGDCNDAAAAIHPGAIDVCDDLDNDCSGVTDDACDVDGDGYCAAEKTTLGQPATCPNGGADCNDGDKTVHPTASETCNGVDDDCNAVTDEGVKTAFYWDGDGDAFGDTGSTTLACKKPAGHALVGGDCDDSDGSIHPGATETCNGKDDDCNGENDEGVKTTYFLDGDGDTFGLAGATTEACSLPAGYATVAQDCDDASKKVHPGAVEACNGYDDDCNGVTDGQDSTGCAAHYGDSDSDGFGPTGGATLCLCVGTVQNPTQFGGDCNDDSASVHPGATETCNGVDDNCDQSIDEGVKSTFYQDSDGDTFGSASATELACSAPANYVSDATDCNDAVGSVHPGATETCNNVDDNCDGTADEGVKTTFYRDQDGDTFGNLVVTAQACSAPTGFVANSLDCDDGSATVNPGVAETCNGVDDNCTGVIDENVGVGTACNNTNGFGTCVGVKVCNGAAGMSCTASTPAADTCNGQDEDCDGQTDEGDPGGGLTCNTGKLGVCAAGTTLCSAGAVLCTQDVAPSAETCDGKDNNCNGTVDEGDPGGGGVCDTSKPGVCGAGTRHCQGGGFVCVQAVQPSVELCDGLDNNCDTIVDEGNPGGGALCNTGLNGVCAAGTTLCSSGALQCTQDVAPSAETCDGKDNNCNGTVDEGDPGGGGACDTGKPGVCGAGTFHCQGGALVCVQLVQPSVETCDGLDNNCDTIVDEGNPGGGAVCGTGSPGICAAGTQQCVSGALQCVQFVTAGVEICNGLDDDCDSIADEGILGGQACSTGLNGVCAAGTTVCSAGALACNQNTQPSAEICDGLDNDCDGAFDGIDDSLVLPLCPNQQGVCAGATRMAGFCASGVWLPGCDYGEYWGHNHAYGPFEVCGDGVDNDCNGVAEEGCP